MRGGRREKGSETSISRRRRAAVKAPSRGKCRTQSQQQQLEGSGVGSGIPMPQLLHTGRRRGHLNEVLTDIQARSEAELPKNKKKTHCHNDDRAKKLAMPSSDFQLQVASGRGASRGVVERGRRRRVPAKSSWRLGYLWLWLSGSFRKFKFPILDDFI